MNFEWIHVAIGLVSAIFGGGAGLATGVWRVARIEGKVRDEFKQCIDETKREIEEKVEALVGQFQETFQALRQKINDVELESERGFVAKEGFDEFRREYREDMRLLNDKLDRMPRFTAQ